MRTEPLSPRNFRTDINGLRAWAVVSVVLFHFGISGFSGGFVGVDIFFVISGFLMTGIIYKGLSQADTNRSKFSILDFYLSRAKRIIPALLVLCSVLLVVGWFFQLSSDYRLLGMHSAMSLAFLSNIKYWKEAGYFDTESHEKWLLHTWSLSVEWQFYLILPLLMLALWKIKTGKTPMTILFIVCSVASLLASIIITKLNPSAAFYLLPTRAWEMLAGGLVFLLSDKINLSAAKAKLVETTGIILLLYSIFAYDGLVPWPSWNALVPVIGSMLVLLAARQESIWTSNYTAQWLGTRSYSIYLWHWPIWVGLGYLQNQHDPKYIVLGLIATLLLGHISYQYIEEPFRKQFGKSSRVRTSIALAVCVATISAIGVTVRLNDGFLGRLSETTTTIEKESLNFNSRRPECLGWGSNTSPSCLYGGDTIKAVVVGDSHSDTVMTAIEDALPSDSYGVRGISYSGCPTIFGVKKVGTEKNCIKFNEWILSEITKTPSSVPVIIVNRLTSNIYGANETPSQNNTPQIYFSTKHKNINDNFLSEVESNIISSICLLAKTRKVYIVRPIPEMGVHVPKTMALSSMNGNKTEVSISLSDYNTRHEFTNQTLDKAAEQCGVVVLDPTPYLCSEGRCHGEVDGIPLYADDNHLSEKGNRLLIPMFEKVLSEEASAQN